MPGWLGLAVDDDMRNDRMKLDCCELTEAMATEVHQSPEEFVKRCKRCKGSRTFRARLMTARRSSGFFNCYPRTGDTRTGKDDYQYNLKGAQDSWG
jgi:hypothetical protein